MTTWSAGRTRPWTQFAVLAALACGVYVAALKPASMLFEALADRPRLREQEEIISLMLKEFDDKPADWLWHFDRDGKVERVSDRFADASGHTRDGLVGKNFRELLRDMSGENAATILELESDIANRAIFHDIVIKVDRDGLERWWRLTGKSQCLRPPIITATSSRCQISLELGAFRSKRPA